jgi:hypothetical protein
MSNLAFEIGFDHYLYKLPLDITRLSDVHRQRIRHGYDAAKSIAESLSESDFPLLLKNDQNIFVSWNNRSEGYRLIPVNK